MEIGITDCDTIHVYHIEEVIDRVQQEKGLVNSSRNRHGNVIASILKWGNRTKRIDNRDDFRFRRKKERWKTRYLNDAEVRKLIAEVKHPISRDVLIFALHTGARKGEVFNLKWQDIDFDNMLVHIATSKGGRDRYVPISPTLKRAIFRIKRRRKRHGVVQPGDWVFQWAGKQMTGRYMEGIRDAVRKLNMKDVSFHTLRHTFASNLVRRGVDIFTVSKLLGHNSLTTTYRYAHLDTSAMKNIANSIDSVSAPVIQ